MPEHDAVEAAPQDLVLLAESALRCWGKEGCEVRLVKMRENAVFRIVDRDRAFALRVHRQDYHSDVALRSELQWMSALQAAGIDVPTIVPALDGRLFVKAQLREALAARQVDLFEWIDGRQLGSSEAGLDRGLADVAGTYRMVGSLMARLHNQAAAWPLPSGFQRHHWDLEGLVGEQPLWGRFWELAALTGDERELLLQARERVRRELGALAGSADANRCHGLIHADLVPENLLLPADGRLRLIDFDDAGVGWHGFELATALYFLQDDARYAAARAGLVAGYRVHRSLPDADLERLPMFLAARGFTYLGWVHTRPMSKDSLAITPLLIRLACRQAERLLDT